MDLRAQLSHEINARYMVPPSWWAPNASLVEASPPVIPHLACSSCSREGMCTRCKADAEDEVARKQVRRYTVTRSLKKIKQQDVSECKCNVWFRMSDDSGSGVGGQSLPRYAAGVSSMVAFEQSIL